MAEMEQVVARYVIKSPVLQMVISMQKSISTGCKGHLQLAKGLLYASKINL